MEAKITETEIKKHNEIVSELYVMQYNIETKAREAVINILNRYEDKTIAFSDNEDDDEDFTIDVLPDGNVLVDSVTLISDTHIILHGCNNEDYFIWETNKSVLDVYYNIVHELKNGLKK